jgi:putative transposon-encoded protein
MSEITIKENITDMFDAEVRSSTSMTYIPVGKKFAGKKVKILVLKNVK